MSIASATREDVAFPPFAPSSLTRPACVIRQRRVRMVRSSYRRAKRVMDVALCLLIMPVALPIMAVCAALIWLTDPGPIIFRQRRPGRGGVPYSMLKFRTMVKNAKELEKDLAHLNELTWPDFKITNDPRVTRIGRFLRKTSLDELPQLFNVLRGEMSLVGPRPTCFGVDQYAVPQTERLEVLPGITGLWQVSGRSDLDLADKLRLDSQYIEQQSVWLDVKILFWTIPAVFMSRGAY